MNDVLVVLSGGQDSTTCLYWAKREHPGAKIHALTFDYNQRHRREIQAARDVSRIACVDSHTVLELGTDILLSSSPLTNHNREVGHYKGADALPGGIEPTFVPMRNALFAVLAANRAVALGASFVVMGVCQEDFGGYPDCRQVFIDRMERAINTGLVLDLLSSKTLDFETPLMNMTKAKTVELAMELDGCMSALAYSHTCYDGEYPPNPHNHASILRARGFAQAGCADPLIVRAINEGLLPVDYPRSGLVEGTEYALKE